MAGRRAEVAEINRLMSARLRAVHQSEAVEHGPLFLYSRRQIERVRALLEWFRVRQIAMEHECNSAVAAARPRIVVELPCVARTVCVKRPSRFFFTRRLNHHSRRLVYSRVQANMNATSRFIGADFHSQRQPRGQRLFLLGIEPTEEHVPATAGLSDRERAGGAQFVIKRFGRDLFRIPGRFGSARLGRRSRLSSEWRSSFHCSRNLARSSRR